MANGGKDKFIVDFEDGTQLEFDSQPTRSQVEQAYARVTGQEQKLSTQGVRTPLEALSKLIPTTTQEAVTPGSFAQKLVGEVSAREEAAFANPIIDFQRGERNLGKIIGSSIQGITGQRVNQIGDVFREAGVDEESSATAGFLLASLLPSNLLLGGAFKRVLTEKDALKFAETFSRTPNAAKGKTVEIMANFLAKDPRRVQQLLDNPHIYSPTNADFRQSKIIANKISKGLDWLKKNAPDTLEPNPNIPFDIGKKAISGFDKAFDLVQKKWVDVTRGLRGSKEPLINARQLFNQFTEFARSPQLDLTRKVLIQGSGAEEAVKSLQDIGKALVGKEKGARFAKNLTLDDLLKMRKDLGSRLRGKFTQGDVVVKPSEEATILLKAMRRQISDIIQERFPAIKEADELFSNLSDIREDLIFNRLKDPTAIGNLLRSKNPNPIKMESLQNLDIVLADSDRIMGNYASYLAAKEDSLLTQLGRIGIKPGKGNASAIERTILNFDHVDTPISDQQILRKLDNILPGGRAREIPVVTQRPVSGIKAPIKSAGTIQGGFKFWEQLTKHDLARSFSKMGSLFKAGAASGLGSHIMGGGAPPAVKQAGVLAGLVATIPPFFAEVAKNRAVRSFIRSPVGFPVREGLRRLPNVAIQSVRSISQAVSEEE